MVRRVIVNMSRGVVQTLERLVNRLLMLTLAMMLGDMSRIWC